MKKSGKKISFFKKSGNNHGTPHVWSRAVTSNKCIGNYQRMTELVLGGVIMML